MWQIVINGPGYFDTSYELPDGPTFLGRADNNDIVLSGDQVSRRHARIEVNKDRLTVEDLNSRNGSLLNGERITDARSVKPGDVIQVGENLLSIRQPHSAESAKTDPIDADILQANGLMGVPIMTEVLVERGLAENPFVSSFRELEAVNTGEFKLGKARAARSAEAANHEHESLWLLLRISEKLATAASVTEFLNHVIDLVVEVAQARTGVALLKDERSKLVPAVVRHSQALAKGEVPVSDAILAEVAQKRKAMAVAHAKGDSRFSARESVLLYDVDQVLCAPMLHGDDFIGLVYLNRDALASEAMPLERLVDVVSAIAHMAASGVEKWRLKEKVPQEQRVRHALERFHAPAVIERAIADSKSGVRMGATMEPREATVMFGDIAGFTALTERLEPQRLVGLLNEYYARMTRVIFSFDGTVDKFMGDAVMAIFGAPYSKGDDASRAVRCALACRRELVEMMAQRPLDERREMKLGLNTGMVLAGTLGGDSRIDYSALGEPVNIAARLHSMAAPGQVLITGKTLAAIGARFDVAPLGERELKSKKQKVAVFEVLEEDSEQHTKPGV